MIWSYCTLPTACRVNVAVLCKPCLTGRYKSFRVFDSFFSLDNNLQPCMCRRAQSWERIVFSIKFDTALDQSLAFFISLTSNYITEQWQNMQSEIYKTYCVEFDHRGRAVQGKKYLRLPRHCDRDFEFYCKLGNMSVSFLYFFGL